MKTIVTILICILTPPLLARPTMRHLVSSLKSKPQFESSFDLPEIAAPHYCEKDNRLIRCEECRTKTIEWAVVDDDKNGFVEVRDACVNGLGIGFRSQYALFSPETGNPLLVESIWITGGPQSLRVFELKGTQLAPLSAPVFPNVPVTQFLRDGFDPTVLDRLKAGVLVLDSKVSYQPRIAFTLPRFGTDIIADVDMPFGSIAFSHMNPGDRKLVLSFFKGRKYFVIIAFDTKTGAFVIKERRARDNASSAATHSFLMNYPEN